MKSLAFRLILASSVFCHIAASAQSDAVKEKIAQVEKNLVPSIQYDEEKQYTIAERMAHYHIQGLSIAVISNFQVDWAKGYGWADAGLKSLALSCG